MTGKMDVIGLTWIIFLRVFKNLPDAVLIHSNKMASNQSIVVMYLKEKKLLKQLLEKFIHSMYFDKYSEFFL